MYSEFEIELPTWRSFDQTGFSTGRAMMVGKDGVRYVDINRLEVFRATDEALQFSVLSRETLTLSLFYRRLGLTCRLILSRLATYLQLR
jgi:hypothetical protein